MTGAGAHHALAVEVHLRPVLVELGATLPTRGLYVTEGELPEADVVIANWLRVICTRWAGFSSASQASSPVEQPMMNSPGVILTNSIEL